MQRSLIGLGANLGDRRATLERAVALLSAHPGVESLALSSFHETRPVGGPSKQGAFLNAALLIQTKLAPESLLEVLRQIETQLGRTRDERWAARTLDLDLLLCGDEIIDSPALQVPHPRLSFRRFILEPAVEIAPDLAHPFTGSTLRQLLDHLNSAADYVAILGMPGRDRRVLARDVARECGGTYLPDPVAEWDVAASRDPSSPAFWLPIQFLDRAAGLLEEHVGHSERPIVSDFYFDECLAYARVSLDEESCRQLHKQWTERQMAVPRPKLLVVLDAWEAAAAIRQGRDPKPLGTPPAERLRRELIELSLRHAQGPVVYAPGGDAQTQMQEITAAIAAIE